MNRRQPDTIDQMVLEDNYGRAARIISVVLFASLATLGQTTPEVLVVVGLSGLLIVQALSPLVLSRATRLANAWATIWAYLVAFSLIDILVLEPGAGLEIVGLVMVVVATFWRGKLGFMLSASVLSASWLLNAAIDDLPLERAGYLVGYIFTVIISGVFLDHYTHKQQIERKQIIRTEARAVREGTQLRSLINSMADAVIATDEQGTIQLYNAAALLLLNTNQGLRDTKLSRLVKLRDKDGEVQDIFAQAREQQRIIQRDDLVFTNNRDENVNLYLDLAPVRTGHDNRIDGYIFLLRDITKQKTIEEQRDDFISIISHELRTPITIAEANLSTALLDAVTGKKKQQEMVKQAHKNVLFLADLVNDITTLAHAERGDLDESRTQLNITTFLHRLGDNYQAQIKEAGLKLKFDIDDELPIVPVHKQRLAEIMQDYLTNAIRYTNDGTITIIGHELTPEVVRIGVKDSGIGLSKSDQAHVFEKFYRSEDYRTRQHKGTGLGLYIANKLAELIDVRLGVESKLNDGSYFYVDIPTTHLSGTDS